MNTSEQVTRMGLEIENISKSFEHGALALNKTSFTIQPGEMVALIGASGSGKSTLLRHVAGFLPANTGSGCIRVGSHTVQNNGQVHRRIRSIRSDIGFIFQQFNLVGRLNVLTNVLTGMLPRVPLWRSLIGRFTNSEQQEAFDALRMVGIEELAYQRASTLSGGQQQRVAIARCMLQHAKVILADEPIASLDPESARTVMDLLAKINQAHGITVLVSLHQVQFARRYCARTIALRMGEVIYDGPSTELTAQHLRNLYGVDVNELLDGTESLDLEPV
ncbi:MAG: phosphonate ABC transporter ATP-binding protein [Betaproteobacteria bacterium]|nr:phosphonate ABC transporter ATP-binding protein [Betaproteobacteria bacterium]NBY04139.1 phosphonate ABC transporter ATP-binding protein [Betaproteobacteria bacterium]